MSLAGTRTRRVLERKLLGDPSPGAAAPVAIWELYGQRECIPGTAHLVRRFAPLDPDVKPRWHHDDAGWANRAKGTHYDAPAGSYAHIRAWSGRDDWLKFAVPTAMTVHADVLKALHLSRAAFTRWAESESLYANPRTGRRCVVRPITVAKVAELGKSTVDRCRQAANKLGLRVVVQPGRMLTRDEIGWRPGDRHRVSNQRGLSAETALTTSGAVDNLVLKSGIEVPTRGVARLAGSSRFRRLTYHAASGESKETAAPPRPNRRRKRGSQPAVVVARDLRASVAFLRRCKLSEIIPVVHKCATNALMPWTAYDVITHMDAVNRARGFTSITSAHIRTTPAAVLAWYLRDVDPQADHPRMKAFLAGTALEQRAPWCGACDKVTRHVQVGELPARCPRCHPLAGEQPW